MHKWLISGSDSFYRITKTDVASKTTESFDADGPMPFVKTLEFIAEHGNHGDLIFCPNGTVLSVAQRTANA